MQITIHVLPYAVFEMIALQKGFYNSRKRTRFHFKLVRKNKIGFVDYEALDLNEAAELNI